MNRRRTSRQPSSHHHDVERLTIRETRAGPMGLSGPTRLPDSRAHTSNTLRALSTLTENGLPESKATSILLAGAFGNVRGGGVLVLESHELCGRAKAVLKRPVLATSRRP